MKRGLVLAVALLLAVGVAEAQNLSLRGPAWAQPLLAADLTPTTGGRLTLNDDGIDLAARITIAPYQGGVARVVRYEAHGDVATISLRRFTGHPSTGWWLWGPDTPAVSHPSAAVRQEMATLIRNAMGVSASLGNAVGLQSCPNGEQAFVEVSMAGRATSATRACVSQDDPVGRLASRLSALAGSRTEEELAAAAQSELLDADRAFAAMAQSDGAPQAFEHYAASDAIMMTGDGPLTGENVAQRAFEGWPHGARLEWAPVTGRVSSRGDMGWTWGQSTYTAPDGSQRRGRYITTWKRDYEGNWRFAFDGALRMDPPARPTAH
ncbi:MAG TPA: nuclear transport factor 2 family protein [Caulobacterales bacterium]|nr:nuclear transport factor 2 family protein [Caulobacterales bacterium]